MSSPCIRGDLWSITLCRPRVLEETFVEVRFQDIQILPHRLRKSLRLLKLYPGARSRYIVLLIKKAGIDVRLLIRLSSFWVKYADSKNHKLKLATNNRSIYIVNRTPIADNRKWITAILQCDYGHLGSFMGEKWTIKYMILAKYTDMNAPEDIAIVGIIFQVCLQRENNFIMPLCQIEAEKGLQLYIHWKTFNWKY